MLGRESLKVFKSEGLNTIDTKELLDYLSEKEAPGYSPDFFKLLAVSSSVKLYRGVEIVNSTSKKVEIVNVLIDNLSLTELLDNLEEGVVFTPNVDHVMKLQRDAEFREIYALADYKVCDSKIVEYASKFLGTPLKEKISGSDLFPAFYNHHKHNEEVKIFLLGAQEGVAQKARDNINAKVGREMVVGAHSPSFGFEKNQKECLEIVEKVNRSGATVLGVGVGAPKQEKWISSYKDIMPNIKIFLAIGATIEFEAGHKKRSPKWMSECGIEWLHRLISEPTRLAKRYLVDDLPFLWLVLKQKLAIQPNRVVLKMAARN